MEDVLDKVDIDKIIAEINHADTDEAVNAIEAELQAQGVYVVW